MNTQAILFDMDGVLAPTECIRAQTHVETVRRFGGEVRPSFYTEIKAGGKSHEDTRRAYIQESGIAVSEEEYSATFQEFLCAHLRAIEPTPGIPEILKKLNAKRYRLAVVSSSSNLETVLTKTRMAHYFVATVSGADVARKKPSPEAYLLALDCLSICADDAVAIEDSESGIASAYAAGIRVFALRHPYNANHDFADAWRVFSSVEEMDLFFSRNMLRSWNGGRF